MSAIAFAKHVEFGRQVLWVSLKERLKEPVHVFADLLLSADIIQLVSIRKANSNRLVNPHDVGTVVPAVFIADRVSAFSIDTAWTIFAEQCESGAAPTENMPQKNE